MTIEFIISISIIFYALIYFFVVLKISLDDFKKVNGKENSNVKLLNFSIIVPAKNEERNMKNLVAALKNLAFPEVNYEVIIVDDNSNDDTFNLATNLTNKYENFTVISAINKKSPEIIRGWSINILPVTF